MSASPDRLSIEGAGGCCTILPALGGSLASWTFDGQPMLRTASAAAIVAGDPLGMASFPLVPFSNRIADARFRWNGADIALAPNFPPEPHAIHGVGWQRPWQAEQIRPNTARLRLLHEGDSGWPWPFEAEQIISVEGAALSLALRLQNRAAHSVPAGFGHHFYFDQAGATLQFAARRIWLNGPDMLPCGSRAPSGRDDFAASAPVAASALDNCYDGLSGPARIAWAGRRHALSIAASASLPAAVVYAPTGGAAFCYEPVPHSNNALNMPGESVPVIAAGEWFESSISLGIVAT